MRAIVNNPTKETTIPNPGVFSFVPFVLFVILLKFSFVARYLTPDDMPDDISDAIGTINSLNNIYAPYIIPTDNANANNPPVIVFVLYILLLYFFDIYGEPHNLSTILLTILLPT